MKVYVVMLLKNIYDSGMIVGEYTEVIDTFDNPEAANQLENYLNSKVKDKGYAFVDEFDVESTFKEENYFEHY